jgi:ketosteroid isomerase-like protein
MSEENVETARRTYATLNVALATGEFREGIETFFDPEIVIKPSGTFPETSELHGHEGVLRFLAGNTEPFEDFRVEPQEFIDAGDSVVVPVHFGGRAIHTGIEVSFDAVHTWTARGGKWIRLDLHRSKAEALEAAGLEE